MTEPIENATLPTPAPPVFTVIELAARWRCSRSRIMELVHAGRIASFKLGQRKHRIRLEEVLRIEREGLPTEAA